MGVGQEFQGLSASVSVWGPQGLSEAFGGVGSSFGVVGLLGARGLGS